MIDPEGGATHRDEQISEGLVDEKDRETLLTLEENRALGAVLEAFSTSIENALALNDAQGVIQYGKVETRYISGETPRVMLLQTVPNEVVLQHFATTQSLQKNLELAQIKLASAPASEFTSSLKELIRQLLVKIESLYVPARFALSLGKQTDGTRAFEKNNKSFNGLFPLSERDQLVSLIKAVRGAFTPFTPVIAAEANPSEVVAPVAPTVVGKTESTGGVASPLPEAHTTQPVVDAIKPQIDLDAQKDVRNQMKEIVDELEGWWERASNFFVINRRIEGNLATELRALVAESKRFSDAVVTLFEKEARPRFNENDKIIFPEFDQIFINMFDNFQLRVRNLTDQLGESHVTVTRAYQTLYDVLVGEEFARVNDGRRRLPNLPSYAEEREAILSYQPGGPPFFREVIQRANQKHLDSEAKLRDFMLEGYTNRCRTIGKELMNINRALEAFQTQAQAKQ